MRKFFLRKSKFRGLWAKLAVFMAVFMMTATQAMAGSASVVDEKGGYPVHYCIDNVEAKPGYLHIAGWAYYNNSGSPAPDYFIFRNYYGGDCHDVYIAPSFRQDVIDANYLVAGTKTGFSVDLPFQSGSYSGDNTKMFLRVNNTPYPAFSVTLTIDKPTATFDKQNGKDGTDNVEVDYNTANPKITPPTRSGYAFMGYYTAKGGGGTKYYNSDGTSAANWKEVGSKTLYAYWKALICNNVQKDKKYLSIQEAINDAASGDTLKMIHNSQENLIFPANKSLVFNLNGFMLQPTDENVAITIEGNSNLTLIDNYKSATKRKFKVDSKGLWTLTSDAETLSYDTMTVRPAENAIVAVMGGLITNGGTYGKGFLVKEGGKLTVNGGNIGGFYCLGNLAAGTGICGKPNSEIIINGGNIFGNVTSNDGGGVFTNGKMTFTGGTISFNSGKHGGGINRNHELAGDSNGGFIMTGGKVYGNKATNAAAIGGGIYLGTKYESTITGGEIKNNISVNGGGIGANRDGATVIIGGDVVISGNTTTNGGGAIYNSWDDGKTKAGVITLGKVEFNKNKATQGGAIYNDAVINLTDTVALNSKSDSIYNSKNATLNWDITGENTYGKIFGYQYLKNDGGKLTIAVNEEQKIENYALGIYKSADLTGKDTFTLNWAGSKVSKTISVGDSAYYKGRLYKLKTAKDAIPPLVKENLRGVPATKAVPKDTLLLMVRPCVCKNVDTKTYYETLDSAFVMVKTGETIELLTNVEMKNDLEIPSGIYLDLKEFTLTNPAGVDLMWNLTKDNAPVIKSFDKLSSQGTLTLNMNDQQTLKDYVLAQDAAAANGKAFLLPGTLTFDKNARTLTVNGGKVFYGHRFYSLALNSNNEIVLTVEKVIPANNEFWAVATGDTKLTLGSTQGYGAGNTGSTLVAEDALTRFEFDSDVTRIALSALENNDLLKEVYFPASVESVGQYAFEDCKNLEYVSTGENLEKINDRAFNGCTKLQFIDLEDNKQLKEIAAYAFGGSEALKSVTLPASVEYIGSRAFYGCKNLTSVTLLGTDPEAINMTAESFKGMAEDASVFVNSDKLLTFEAYNYGKGINFQTKKTVEILGGRTGIFCHHNMIVPEGITAYDATWNGSEFVKSSAIAEGEIVEGGKGYILEGGAGNYVVETTSKDATITVDNDLKGIMESTKVGELRKLGRTFTVNGSTSDVMIEQESVSDGLTLGAYTAVGIITSSNQPLVKLFDFDSWYYGWATGVQTLSEVRSEELGVRSYNISGQQVGNEYKGVVIKNGKKYLNK